MSGGSVQYGLGGFHNSSNHGQAFGSGIFVQGNDTLTFAPGAGKVLAISDVIADQSGSGGTGGNAGTASIVMDGPGWVVLGAVNTFTGGITIESGTLELAVAGAAGSGAITFENDPSLVIDGKTMPTNDIDGFAPGDTITLGSIGYDADGHADMDYTTNVLTITEDGATYTLNFDPTAHFAGHYFHLAEDVTGGTLITEDDAPCYCRGTSIATEAGEKAVEDLAIGDHVMTVSGALRPIKWIGRRGYSGRFIMGRKDVLPICVTAGSLGDEVPRRDLWISPHHAMYLDGVLIEAKDLANGVSIVQAEHVDEIEYFHIELDSHDVILAEGAPSESFVDDDSRGMFHNVHEYARLYPGQNGRQVRYCAPRVDNGFELDAARRRIAARAGLSSSAPTAGFLRGHVDRVSARAIEGWAQDADHPEVPVCLDIFIGGKMIGQALANRYREDLRDAGLGSGRHAFEFTPPAGLAFAPNVVEVHRSIDRAALFPSEVAKRKPPLSAACGNTM
jgi:autotransporter-associated beta strand protein